VKTETLEQMARLEYALKDFVAEKRAGGDGCTVLDGDPGSIRHIGLLCSGQADRIGHHDRV